MRTIEHFFPDLVDRLNGVKDPRAKAGLYSIAELVGACIAMFLLKQGSRKAMNDSRYEGRFAKNYRKFFKPLKLPHMDTVDEVMRVLKEEELEALKRSLVGVLLKKKVFHSSRLGGQYFCIAVDGSGIFSFREAHCEHCLTKTMQSVHYSLKGKAIRALREEGLPKWVLQALQELVSEKFESLSDFFKALDEKVSADIRQSYQDSLISHLSFEEGSVVYSHQVLEAKLVTEAGFAISIATEWIENPEGEFDKQDCELKACRRLAEKLKKSFPRLPICLVVDGLYPCEPFFELCQKKKWAFISVFKDETLPSIQEQVAETKKLEEGEERVVESKESRGKLHQHYQWINAIDYHGFSVNWLELTETLFDEEGQAKTTRFVFLTTEEITPHNVLELVETGRRRWKIENQGFNSQKNLGYEMQHQYSRTSLLAAKNYYQCLQIAHMINQLCELSQTMKERLTQWKSSLKHLWKTLFAFLIYDPFDQKELDEFLGKKVQFRYA